jgi:hypothetical protein
MNGPTNPHPTQLRRRRAFTGRPAATGGDNAVMFYFLAFLVEVDVTERFPGGK